MHTHTHTKPKRKKLIKNPPDIYLDKKESVIPRTSWQFLTNLFRAEYKFILGPLQKMSQARGSGRGPWYSHDGKTLKPFMIGVGGECYWMRIVWCCCLMLMMIGLVWKGGTASGKTTVCQKIIQKLNVSWAVVLSTDRYYRTLSAEEKANVATYNFDLPRKLIQPFAA